MALSVPIPYRDPIALRRAKPGRDERREHVEGLAGPVWLKWFTAVNAALNLNPINTPYEYQEFNSVDFWSNAPGPGAGTVLEIDGETDHPGLVQLTTGAINGDITSTWIPVANGVGIVRWDQLSYGRFVFRTPADMTTVRFEMGLSDNPGANWTPAVFEVGANMVYVFYDTAVDTALRIKLRAAGVETNSFVVKTPCPPSTWLDCTFQRRLTGSTYVLDCIVNGATRTTFSTGLPANSTTYGGMFRVGTRAGAARSLDVDFADIRPVTISQRWSDSL